MGVSKTKDSVTGPLHLALDITNKCNYRCLHCYNAAVKIVLLIMN